MNSQVSDRGQGPECSASLLLTTEMLVSEIPEKEKADPMSRGPEMDY
jgi:hypothetical protein